MSIKPCWDTNAFECVLWASLHYHKTPSLTIKMIVMGASETFHKRKYAGFCPYQPSKHQNEFASIALDLLPDNIKVRLLCQVLLILLFLKIPISVRVIL